MPVGCVYCLHENRLSAAFCGGCGRRLVQTDPCVDCGALNPQGQRYCNTCGDLLSRPGVGPAPAASEALAVAAASATDSAPKGEVPAAPNRTRRDMVLYAAAAALLAIAVFARVDRLATVPSETLGDDLAFVQAAATVVEQGWIGIRSDLTLGQPTGLAYLLAVWTALIGDSVVSVRLLAVALGLGALGLTYLMVRQVFGQRPAVFAMLLLAFGEWHLRYSRAALPEDLLLLLEVLTVYLLWRALAENRESRIQRWLLVPAGLTFGASAYTHNAFWIFAAAVLLFWGWELLAAQGATRAVVTRRAARFFLPALIVASPYFVSLAANAEDAGDRLRRVSVTSTQEYRSVNGVTEQTRHVLVNMGRAAAVVLMGRVVEEDGGGPAGRLARPVTALLALIGLVAGIRRWGTRGHAYIWLLLTAGIVGAGLTSEAGMYGRLVVVVPAVFGAAGFGLHWLLTWLRGRVKEGVSYALVVLLLAFVAYQDLNAFLDDPAPPSASAAKGLE